MNGPGIRINAWRFAMHSKGHLRFVFKLTHPLKQFFLISMTRHGGEVFYFGLHRYILSEDSYRWLMIQQSSPSCAFGLVAGNKKSVLLVRKPVIHVMQDTPAGHHAT